MPESPPLTTLLPGSFLRWAFTAAAYLADRQDDLDELNVFPVPDGDTGTNLLHTLSCALEMLLSGSGAGEQPLQASLDALSRDALWSARGNSGVILSQLITGLAEGIAASQPATSPDPGAGQEGVGPVVLAAAMQTAAARARDGVQHPVEGTMLTVASAAALAARAAADAGGTLAGVVGAATSEAAQALARTPAQLPQLAEAGVVDAGGAGLLVILQALDDVVHRRERASAPGGVPRGPREPAAGTGHVTGHARPAAACPAPQPRQGEPGPDYEYEVVYRLPGADPAALGELRSTLERVGDSVVVAAARTGDEAAELVTVHVHTADPGAAIEAGMAAGRPVAIRLELLPGEPATPGSGAAALAREPRPGCPAHPQATGPAGEPARAPAPAVPAVTRAVPGPPGAPEAKLGLVAGGSGHGLAGLLAQAGAQVVTPAAGGSGDPARLVADMQAAIARTGCATVLVLPGRPECAIAARAAAVRVAGSGIEVIVADTRSPVQAVAALTVHDPAADPASEALRLARVAGAVRCGWVEISWRAATYAAGRCRRGDLLGYGDDDVRAVGADSLAVSRALVEHLLTRPAPDLPPEAREPAAGPGLAAPATPGGELVTLIAGQGHQGMARQLADDIRAARPEIEVAWIDGGQHDSVLLVGVE